MLVSCKNAAQAALLEDAQMMTLPPAEDPRALRWPLINLLMPFPWLPG
jgi:hypothetical protein